MSKGKFPKKLSGYKRIQLLGKGTFGEVWEVEHEGNRYVIKSEEIKPRPGERYEGFSPYALNEADLIMRFVHPNIVSALEIFVDDSPLSGSPPVLTVSSEADPTQDITRPPARDRRIHILMKKAIENLKEFIDVQNKSGLTRQEFITFVHDIFCALEFLHKHGYIHSDVKPHNLLVFEESGRRVVKLADFGSSQRVTREKKWIEIMSPYYKAPETIKYHKANIKHSSTETEKDREDHKDEKKEEKDSEDPEDPKEEEPEDLKEEEVEDYGTPADIWGAGITLFYMLFDDEPVHETDQEKFLEKMKQHLETKDFVQATKFSTEQGAAFVDANVVYARHLLGEDYQKVVDLMMRCLELDPSKRITAAEALALPLFNDLEIPTGSLNEGKLVRRTPAPSVSRLYKWVLKLENLERSTRYLAIDLFERFNGRLELEKDSWFEKEEFCSFLTACVILAIKLNEGQKFTLDWMGAYLKYFNPLGTKYLPKHLLQLEEEVVNGLDFVLFPEDFLKRYQVSLCLQGS